MKKLFQSNDEEIHETEKLCMERDDFLLKMAPVDEYKEALEKKGWKGSALTRRINVAEEFMAYQINKSVPEPPEAAPTAEKPDPKAGKK